jgi:hypothetical protein
MQALQINDKPTIEFRVHLGDFIMSWADTSNGKRFPIRIGRRYTRDVWNVLWHDSALVAAFESHEEEVRAAAEAAYLAGKNELHLV